MNHDMITVRIYIFWQAAGTRRYRCCGSIAEEASCNAGESSGYNSCWTRLTFGSLKLLQRPFQVILDASLPANDGLSRTATSLSTTFCDIANFLVGFYSLCRPLCIFPSLFLWELIRPVMNCLVKISASFGSI